MSTLDYSSSIPTEQSSHHESIEVDDNSPLLPSLPLTDSQNPTGSSVPNEEQNDTIQENSASKKRKERSGGSKARETFQRLKVDGVNDKAQCKDCNKKLSANIKNGTKHLLEHQLRCPTRKTKDLKQSLIVANMTMDGNMQLQNHSFDVDRARLYLTYMVIMHEYPLRIVQYKWFRIFLHTLQPLLKPISRSTLWRDILKIFEEEKMSIMSILESNKSRIAITSDTWSSSNQKKGYMAITAHFIDNSWKLQSRIVRFVYVPCPHTAEVIADVMFDSLLDWNIDHKLYTLTLDNCSTNDAVIDRNSAYKNLPTEHDWLLAAEIFEKLEFFYVLTEMFSATSCPTANKIFIYICEIRLKIDGWLVSEYVAVQLMANTMIAKFKKYWEDIHTIFSNALILDPRFKFKTIDCYFDQIYREEAQNEKEKVRTIMYEIEKEYKASCPKPTVGSKSSSSSSSSVYGTNNIFGGIESLGVYLSGSAVAQERITSDIITLF
ncbi:hypothetical protein C2S52_008710 [Perilla frutescens var. hirtella]|nr:hypothetical protein C2S52_008710 [Perilla frutescens var. hirtella]